MPDIPDTRESLLVRLHDPGDREAWDQFSLLYRPVIYRLARARGLQDADAQDLAQQVLLAVSRAIPDWQRNSQSTQFRRWLRRVAKNAAINALTRRPKDAAGGGTAVMEQLLRSPQPDPTTEATIDWEQRREIFRLAARQVQREVSQSTWTMFARSVIDGQAIELVAEECGKSIGSVYVARCRIMNRLREAVSRLEQELDQ